MQKEKRMPLEKKEWSSLFCILPPPKKSIMLVLDSIRMCVFFVWNFYLALIHTCFLVSSKSSNFSPTSQICDWIFLLWTIFLICPINCPIFEFNTNYCPHHRFDLFKRRLCCFWQIWGMSVVGRQHKMFTFHGKKLNSKFTNILMLEWRSGNECEFSLLQDRYINEGSRILINLFPTDSIVAKFALCWQLKQQHCRLNYGKASLKVLHSLTGPKK